MTANVAIPTNSVAGCRASNAATGPAARSARVAPASGADCAMMMSADTPLMNPATNGYGTYRANAPPPSAPSTICSTPAITTAAPANATMSSGPRVAEGASAGSAASIATESA